MTLKNDVIAAALIVSTIILFVTENLFHYPIAVMSILGCIQMAGQKVFDQSQIKDDTWVLETQILALEKQQQTAIVAIRFSVYDPYRKSMFDKTYRLKQSLDENSIAAFVQSVSLMIADITQQLLGDLP